jgi:hypothetical protein
MLGLSWSTVALGEPPARAPLDTLWEQHMLEGKFVVMSLEDSGVNAIEVQPKSIDPSEPDRIYGSLMSHRISVMKLDEGFFNNGGWVLRGGLHSRISTGESKIELYVKEVVRRFSHFPFPPHRELPQEIGYEFFLLHRKQKVTAPTIIRKWTVTASEVIQQNPRDPSVRVSLKYDATARVATLTITGLKHPFQESIELSEMRGNSPSEGSPKLR